MDILLLVPIALCLWGLRLRHSGEDALSGEATLSLRGLLAIWVILIHLGQSNQVGSVFGLVSRTGHLAVAVFFFLSGYGLQKQHMTRENYAKGFLRKRLLGVVLPYAVVTVLYWSYFLWLGRGYGLVDVLEQFAAGKPLVSYSWYILAVITFYAAFYLLMRLCGKRYSVMLLGGVVWFAVYTAVCVALKFSEVWYVSGFAAVVGMLWAVYQSKIDAFLAKRWLVGLVASIAAVVTCTLLGQETGVVGMVFKVAASSVFPVVVVLLLQKIRLGNPLLRLLGGISMELYLMQGLAMMVLRNRLIFVENGLAYGALVLVVAVFFAMVVHIAFKGIPKNPTP